MDDVDRYRIKLFVAGREVKAEHAKDNIRAILSEEMDEDSYILEVIDILEYPELAEAARILATPTLIKEYPPPARRVIGDLSDRRGVMDGLALKAG